jgi:hypothetical protein
MYTKYERCPICGKTMVGKDGEWHCHYCHRFRWPMNIPTLVDFEVESWEEYPSRRGGVHVYIELESEEGWKKSTIYSKEEFDKLDLDGKIFRINIMDLFWDDNAKIYDGGEDFDWRNFWQFETS